MHGGVAQPIASAHRGVRRAMSPRESPGRPRVTRPRSLAGVSAPLVMALVLLAMIAPGSLVPSPLPRLAAAATVGLQIDDGHLTRDGSPFLPRGFNMVGLLAPAWCTSGQGPAAAAHFGQAELDAAKGWNANTLRFQVSQRGLADTTR